MTKETKIKWCKEHPVLTGIFALVIIITLVSVFSSGDDASSNMKIGEQLVYDNIDNATNCDTLQNVFNIAMDNVDRRQPGDELRKVSLSYANYANERMKILSC